MSRIKWPYRYMEVWDSFLIKSFDRSLRNKAQSAASQYGRRHSRKFTLIEVDDGIRAWRLQ